MSAIIEHPASNYELVSTFSKRVGPSVENTSFHNATATMNSAAPSVAGPRNLCHEGLQRIKAIWKVCYVEVANTSGWHAMCAISNISL